MGLHLARQEKVALIFNQPQEVQAQGQRQPKLPNGSSQAAVLTPKQFQDYEDKLSESRQQLFREGLGHHKEDVGHDGQGLGHNGEGVGYDGQGVVQDCGAHKCVEMKKMLSR